MSQEGNLIMHGGCNCHSGEATEHCLVCKVRQRSIAEKEVHSGRKVEDPLKNKGFCVRCQKVKPLAYSEPASDGDGERAFEKAPHIVCYDCLGPKELL